MNCKPGDLAVIVNSTCGNEGKFVECVEFVGDSVGFKDGRKKDIWRVNILIKGDLGGANPYISDSRLRPIRESDGQDETLTWAPKKVTA